MSDQAATDNQVSEPAPGDTSEQLSEQAPAETSKQVSEQVATNIEPADLVSESSIGDTGVQDTVVASDDMVPSQ